MKDIIKKILKESIDGFENFDWVKDVPEPFDINEPWVIYIGPSKEEQLNVMKFLYSKGFKWSGGYDIIEMNEFDNQHLFLDDEDHMEFDGSKTTKPIQDKLSTTHKLYKWEDIKYYGDMLREEYNDNTFDWVGGDQYTDVNNLKVGDRVLITFDGTYKELIGWFGTDYDYIVKEIMDGKYVTTITHVGTTIWTTDNTYFPKGLRKYTKLIQKFKYSVLP